MMRERALIRGLLSALISAVLVLPVAAQEKKEAAPPEAKGTPSATLDVASEQMRLIMGGTAGKGVLHFEGKDYPFSFKTASLGVGAKMVTKMTAVGKVYGLTKIEDFAGSYTALSQSTMAGSAETTASYKNDKGVTIDLRGKTEGVGLSMGGGMATVKLLKK
jgi:hypothetical protein